jgi:TetR/AcrR family transcriptional regulator, transcriptional repressor for nem operon
MHVKYGCPAVNLVQEMAPLNPQFKQELAKLNSEWEKAIEGAIKNARAAGLVRKNVVPKQVANFVISGYGGVRNMGKLSQTKACYVLFLKELKNYLNSLK